MCLLKKNIALTTNSEVPKVLVTRFISGYTVKWNVNIIICWLVQFMESKDIVLFLFLFHLPDAVFIAHD